MPEPCAQHTSLPEPAVACSPISSLDTSPSSPSSGTPMPAPCCESARAKAGLLDSMSTKATCERSTSAPGPREWIASQRAFLVRTFLRLAEGQVSMAHEAGLYPKYGEASTKSTLPLSSLKTRRASGRKGAQPSSGNCWREDISGETERLVRLMSVPDINVIDGGFLLPTLTVCGNYNRKGVSQKSGDGLVTALLRLGPTLLASAATAGGNYKRGNPKLREWVKQLPTLCARDHKNSGGATLTERGKSRLPSALKHKLPTVCATDFKAPYSAEGYRKQTQQRSKPLRDTLVHTTGHRLTPAFAEWWMGWPIGWTASSVRAMARFRSRQQRRGSSLPKVSSTDKTDHA